MSLSDSMVKVRHGDLVKATACRCEGSKGPLTVAIGHQAGDEAEHFGREASKRGHGGG